MDLCLLVACANVSFLEMPTYSWFYPHTCRVSSVGDGLGCWCHLQVLP